MHLRPLNPASAEEITLIAIRMHDTLIEVEGEARGAAMYTRRGWKAECAGIWMWRSFKSC